MAFLPVITGIGPISSLGVGKNDLWTTISSIERSRLSLTEKPVPPFGAIPCHSVSNWEAIESRVPQKILKYLDRGVAMSVAAAHLALEDAQIPLNSESNSSIGVVEGTATNGFDIIQRGLSDYEAEATAAGSLKPRLVASSYFGDGSSKISQLLDLSGPSLTMCTGCCSGNDAVGTAVEMLRKGIIRYALAGAIDAPLQPPLLAGLWKLGVLAHSENTPLSEMHPFSPRRSGFVAGEGGAFFLIESLASALARGARIYATILGHGAVSQPGSTATGHDNSGIGYKLAIENALRSAHITNGTIDYLNSHGSATRQNDTIEAKAIAETFGPCSSLQINATKNYTGHLLGGAAAIELAIVLLSAEAKLILQTSGTTQLDPDCKIKLQVSKNLRFPIKRSLNLSAGFGGRYSALVLEHHG